MKVNCFIHKRLSQNNLQRPFQLPLMGEEPHLNQMESFRKGNNKIFFGDSLKILNTSLIADSSVNLIFADPPYNIGKNCNGHRDKWESEDQYYDWCKTWIKLLYNKLTPNGSFYLMCSTQSFAFFDFGVCSS